MFKGSSFVTAVLLMWRKNLNVEEAVLLAEFVDSDFGCFNGINILYLCNVRDT